MRPMHFSSPSSTTDRPSPRPLPLQVPLYTNHTQSGLGTGGSSSRSKGRARGPKGIAGVRQDSDSDFEGELQGGSVAVEPMSIANLRSRIKSMARTGAGHATGEIHPH
jgi:hypothetical protein